MKKKFNIKFIIAILIFLIGLSLILYPIVSNYINTSKHNKLIKNYIDDVDKISENNYGDILREAKEYNEHLYKKEMNITSEIKEEDKIKYNELLNINDTGIMGYIEISKINVLLPIYHGTSSTVLQAGAGHIEGSSLPIGGDNTHSIISGHSGLPSAKLFTDLNNLEIGDTFTIKVLKEVFTYEVDNIEIVEPDDINHLKIEEGKDYVTLVTCTPYGINTHRLLVRGHRIDNPKDEKNDELIIKVEKKQNYVLISLCIIIGLCVSLIICKSIKSRTLKHQ